MEAMGAHTFTCTVGKNPLPWCHTKSNSAECEFYGIFRDLIPVQALDQEEELESGRGRQRLLPDFRLELPSSTGEPQYRLAELKMIGAVPTWYPRNGALARRRKAVEMRGEQFLYQESIGNP